MNKSGIKATINLQIELKGFISIIKKMQNIGIHIDSKLENGSFRILPKKRDLSLTNTIKTL
ncbi:hypothetical protein CHELV3228_a0065 (plasmid) [Campylobacter helveticus]|nr:hypothetical protein CHELV3228_a0065 [Campylobacter helveticus]